MTFGPPSGSISGIDTLCYLNQNEAKQVYKTIAQRAPTTADKTGHSYGEVWVDQPNDTVYVFTNVVAGAAQWIVAGGGSSVISTITGDSGGALSPTAGNLNILGTSAQITTTGSGSTLTISIPTTFSIGSTAGAAGATISVGTGNFSLATAVTSTVAIGSADQTGAITLGQSTAGQTVNISAATNVGAQIVNIASGASGANSTVNILSGNASTGTQTLNLATGTGGKTVHLADGAGVNAVTVGSTTSTSATTVQSGSGGTIIASSGTVTLSPAAASGVLLGAGGPKLLVGTGSPNGSVSAVRGSLFIRTDGTGSNQNLYQNVSSGSGTTWEVFTSA